MIDRSLRHPTVPTRPRPRRVWIWCFAFLLSAAPVLAARPAKPTHPVEPGAPTLVTLKNGVRLLLAPDPEARAVDVAAWYDAGVRYERNGQNGISHLVEHLATAATMVDGMDDRRRVESEGGTSSAYTAADYTCFSHTVPPSALEVVLRIEAARLTLKPTAAQLEIARAGVRDELRVRERANPIEVGLQKLYGAAFTAHPYRWPVLGTVADLDKLTLDACTEVLKSRYTPDHLLLTISGDFDPQEVTSLARRHLEPVRTRGDNRTPAVEAAAAHRAVVPGNYPVPMLAVGWRADAQDAPALDVIAALLAQGPFARLGQRLVSGDGRCVLADAGRDGRRDATLFWAIAALQPGADTSSVERDLLAEVEGLAGTPLDGEALDRGRRRVELSMLFGRESARDRGQALGGAQETAGDWSDADRRLERLRALTPADLQQVAARTFTSARRTVVWMRPTSGNGP